MRVLIGIIERAHSQQFVLIVQSQDSSNARVVDQSITHVHPAALSAQIADTGLIFMFTFTFYTMKVNMSAMLWGPLDSLETLDLLLIY